jgi:poly(A) polymerase
MCATHNIGKSSMVVIQQELERGAQVTDEIMIGRRPWKDLFTKHTFFTSGFRYYLTVIASSRTKKEQNAWSGFVESRVRVLVNKLEMHPSIALARPFNKGYDREHRCKDNAQVDEVISVGSLAYVYTPPADGEEKAKDDAPGKKERGPEVKDEDGRRVKQEDSEGAPPQLPETEVKGEDGKRIKQEGSEAAPPPLPDTNTKAEPTNGDDHANVPVKKEGPEEMEIYTTNHYIGLQLVEGAKSLDLSREVNDWKAMCMSNELYQEGLMFLSIQHIKNTTLPDDVFEPGETKPRPVKKGLKRVASEEPSGKQLPAPKRQAQGKAPPPVQRQQPPASTAATAVG